MLCGLGGAKNSATHTGVIVQQWESKREREKVNTKHGWEKRESTEELEEEEEEVTGVQVGQRMRRT